MTPRRIDLGHGAWVDHQSGWLKGHQQLMDQLVSRVRWQQRQRSMWDRVVLEPRLTAAVPDAGDAPVLHDIGAALARRYAASVRRITLSLYRDGRDSVAAHSDRGDAGKPGALTVSVSLGAPRKLLLKPKAGGRSRAFHLGWGDLFVMGGTIQQTWTHGVPKCAQALPRLACLFWLRGPRVGDGGVVSGGESGVQGQAAVPGVGGFRQQP